MSNLDFIRKLYNGKNCYSDHMSQEELELLHVHSNVEDIVTNLLTEGKIVFLTGNPGDGKTFLIKMIGPRIDTLGAYIETDLNRVANYQAVAEHILNCYQRKQPAIIAVNEYPFMRLCKQIRLLSPELYDEILRVKQSSIVYDIPQAGINRVAIVDLNDRNLLSKEHNLTEKIIVRLCGLLDADENKSSQLSNNIAALSVAEIRHQLVKLFDMASISAEHIAVRDVFGAIAFVLTACELEDYQGIPYYDAAFIGDNALLQTVQEYDPIFLSSPSMDERLWNGEITQNWRLGAPELWPCDPRFDDSVDEAIELFKSLKREYYFENTAGAELAELQPAELTRCTEVFINLESRSKAIKESLVRGINKLFLPSSDDKKRLRIWTTHRYDLSIDPAVAVSRKYVDASELELQMPRPAEWLRGLEYTPHCLLLKPKHRASPVLTLDIDFIRTLDAVERGYPVNLLSSQYAQVAAQFLQKLNEAGLAEENDDGEILIASRKKSYQRSLFIQDGKYSFEGADE